MVTTPRYLFHHIGCAPFWRGGQCVVQGGSRDPPFFWQFVKIARDPAIGPVMLFADLPDRRVTPLWLAAFLAAFLLLTGGLQHRAAVSRTSSDHFPFTQKKRATEDLLSLSSWWNCHLGVSLRPI